MDSQHHVVKHYAILIGIDAYPDRPLKACVKDVQNIEALLQGRPIPIHIQTFTAAESADQGSSDPTEDPKSWPTYHNVTSAIERITSLAKPGDFIYIHFSGHGTRVEPSSEFSNTSTGDLALVLLDGDKRNNIRYLWGPRLAFSLKVMVDKALVVTLVLDCCFSASVYRCRDTNVRFLPWDPDIDSKFTPDLENSLKYSPRGAESRDASMLPNWLINPDRCAILTACGPHELASELETQDGQIHGALSYFLLPLMKTGGFARKHKDIYCRLRISFRESWPRQNPVLYGNKEQGFFGKVDPKEEIAIIPIVIRDRNLELQAGQAHGVRGGDEFAICALDQAGNTISGPEGDPVIAKVVQARGLTSHMEVLLDSNAIQQQTGLIAKPSARFFLRNLPIRLAPDLPHLGEWLAALRGRSFDVHTDKEKYVPSDQLVLDSNDDDYTILDENGGKLINLPTLPRHQTDFDHICDIMEHMAKNRLVRDLTNKVSSVTFMSTFDAHIINRSGTIFRPECLMEVEEDEKAKFTFELCVENKGNDTLYVFAYNIGPDWQVEDIYCGSYAVIPPRNSDQGSMGVSRKKLKTMVPAGMKGMGHRECRDVVKVFITSQPTSFDFLELPKLGDPVKRNNKNRGSREDSTMSEEWIALNFPIRTLMR